ncbi:MAG TPA: M23 family metallopeptidase, partial [Bacteroidota bacterium]
ARATCTGADRNGGSKRFNASMKSGVVALHALVLACTIVLSGSRLSSPPSNVSGTPPAPAPTDAITTDLADYRWPTDAGNIVTSTFGEFRSMHFHGGIDVSTGDVTGYRVFAMRDGYVSRIRIFATGYGKMLYVRHPDGYTSTYAHLSRFSAAVEHLARAEQLRKQCYPIDLELQPTELPVHKGDVIAYTGDTGIGTPHLHFEIRDQNLDAINPQLCENLLAPDRIPPEIYKLALTPIGEQSLVNGGWGTQIYTAREVGPARYRIRETITVAGSAGFEVNARDRTEGTHFSRGVYRYILSFDGHPYSTATLNRAPMREAQAVGLHFDWALLDQGLGRFEKLYMDAPDALPFFSPRSMQSGTVSAGALRDGPHEFMIEAEDIAGNRAEVSGTVIVSRPPEFELEEAGTELRLRFADPADLQRVVVSTRQAFGGWTEREALPRPAGDVHLMTVPLPAGSYDMLRVVAEDSWQVRSHPRFLIVRKGTGRASFELSHSIEQDFVRVIARTSGVFTRPPVVVVYEGDRRQVVPMTASDLDVYTGTFRPSPSVGGLRRIAAEADVNGAVMNRFEELALYPIEPGKSGTYSIDGGALAVTYDSLSVYRTLLLQVERHDGDEGPEYTLLPLQAVLRDGLLVTMPGLSGGGRQGLYFHGRTSRELLAATPNARTGLFTGHITRSLGDVMVASDDMPPSVSRLTIRSSRSRGVDLSFRASDNLSGIEYERLKLYIDDHVVIPEIDGEHRRVIYRSSDPLDRGSHRLQIRVSDRAGNTSTVDRRFTVR